MQQLNQHKLINKLKKFTLPTINSLNVLCGSSSLKNPTNNKSSRIETLVANYQFYFNHFKPKANFEISSIDIGIKHFSYCKSKCIPCSTGPIVVQKWDKLNLDERYGINFKPEINKASIFDDKRYLIHLTKEMINDLQFNNSDLVIMEAQRTRSSGSPNMGTLPIILKNFTFENLIFNNLYPNFVMLMEPKKMMHFWFYNYIEESTFKTSKNPKKIRKELFVNWYNRNMFELPGFNGDISKKNQLMDYLQLDNKNKLDDLIDSLFYNLTMHYQFRNLEIFDQFVNEDLDFNKFVEERKLIHLDLIQPILDDRGIKAKN
ncbi:unnamed protein product [Candida verbasci]|uniref:Mitochondrial resolvase Ydc2 catalytic domain-containing protein n=1 Tax=Candida verbasci TaxID=1227364 RepID=A0A9W4TRI6_9ASCO|nr:unnamed protein product [Candida verbasci]